MKTRRYAPFVSCVLSIQRVYHSPQAKLLSFMSTVNECLGAHDELLFSWVNSWPSGRSDAASLSQGFLKLERYQRVPQTNDKYKCQDCTSHKESRRLRNVIRGHSCRVENEESWRHFAIPAPVLAEGKWNATHITAGRNQGS